MTTQRGEIIFPKLGLASRRGDTAKILTDEISSSFSSSKPSKLHEFFPQTLKTDYMFKVHQSLLIFKPKIVDSDQTNPQQFY